MHTETSRSTLWSAARGRRPFGSWRRYLEQAALPAVDVECERAHLGDVRAEVAVEAAALHAHQHAQVDRRPVRICSIHHSTTKAHSTTATKNDRHQKPSHAERKPRRKQTRLTEYAEHWQQRNRRKTRALRRFAAATTAQQPQRISRATELGFGRDEDAPGSPQSTQRLLPPSALRISIGFCCIRALAKG
jgi:hypothetical protein